MAPVTLYLKQSQDTGTVCVHAVDSDSNPLDLSAYAQVNFFLKKTWRDADASAVFMAALGSGVVILDPADDGVAEVTIPSSVLSNLRVLYPYPFRLSVVTDTDQQSTPASGVIIINPA